jgi:copper transport protein
VVHGVFTFSVGARGNAGAIGAKLSAAARIPRPLSIGFGVVRFLNLALLLLCGGGALAMLLLLGDVEKRVRRLLLRALVACGALLALVALLGLPFEAAEADGTGLGGGFALTALDAVRHQRFGEVWLTRAWIAALFALLALALQFDWGSRRRIGEASLAVVGIALLVTPSAAGHASVGGALLFVVDLAHVISAGAWIGGLGFVLAALALSTVAERWPLAIRSVPRLSLLATAAVGVLAVAGLINAYLEVGAWRGLWQTTYGELLLAKGALLLSLLALGAYNNRVTVPALRGGAPSPLVRARFLRAASAELLLLVVVVALTAVLIDEPPAKNEVALSASVTAAHAVGPFRAQLRVSPGTVGTNAISITVSSSRRHPPVIAEVDLAADPPAGSGLAPLNLTVIQVAPTRFRVVGADLRRAGRWSFDTTVRVGLRELLARVPIEIRQAAVGT